jgi:LDH2 family malate/lactate/ureidoglycolate dehydrogenase
MSIKQTNSAGKDKERDPDFVNAEIALKRAAKRARKRARQAGIGVIVMQDGRIIEERSDNTD